MAQVPLETRKVRILNVGLFSLYYSRVMFPIIIGENEKSPEKCDFNDTIGLKNTHYSELEW